jgi:LysM repeat protein
MRIMWIRVLAVMVMLLSVGGVQAQSTNLLQNGGLEEGSFGQYRTLRGGLKPQYIANPWNLWIGPQIDQFNNNPAEVVLQAHPGPGPNVVEGSRAQFIECAFTVCQIAIYQQVTTAVAGSSYTASASSQVKACNFVEPATSCGSAVESGAQTRVGIDPNGGTNPLDSDVVWSAFVQPHDTWLSQSVTTNATSTSVTVFLWSQQGSTARLNRTYWDSVTLSGAQGAPGALPGTPLPPPPTPVPTAPPFVDFVVPQGAQPDGSIIHTIQAGDTIDSIAFAYGITRADILSLNDLQSANFIFPGQQLLVREAQATVPPPTATPDPNIGQATVAPPSRPSSINSQMTAIAIIRGDAVQQPIPTLSSFEPTVQAVAQVPTVTSTPVPDSSKTTPKRHVSPSRLSPRDDVRQADESQPTLAPTAPVIQANTGEIDPAARTGQVCVTFFEDANQNRIQEAGEGLLAGGNIQLMLGTNAAGEQATDGASDPYCFNDLSIGDYVASAGAPEGFGLTTPDRLQVRLNPGSTVNVVFGAAEGVQPAIIPTADPNTPLVDQRLSVAVPQRSFADTLLSFSGVIIAGLAGVVLLGGLGTALLLRRR